MCHIDAHAHIHAFSHAHRYTEEEAAQVVHGVLEALAYCHSLGVMHRGEFWLLVEEGPAGALECMGKCRHDPCRSNPLSTAPRLIALHRGL
jgi:hypothetical protein